MTQVEPISPNLILENVTEEAGLCNSTSAPNSDDVAQDTRATPGREADLLRG
jgi:hypothetical protein